jgi:hypothetical protein
MFGVSALILWILLLLSNQPTRGGRLLFRVSKSHTTRHTHTDAQISGPSVETADANLMQTIDVTTVNLYHGCLRRP